MHLYHCVFHTYRRKPVFVEQVHLRVDALIREISTAKGFELVAQAVMPDHVHLLLRLHLSDVPRAMNMFKGILSRRIFQDFPDLRIDMRSNHLWAAGYYARTVDTSTLPATLRYIRNQEHTVDDL